VPWTVYLLRCSDDSLYCGITNDLARRVARHNSGKASKYTRSRLPVQCVWTESAQDKSAALKREVAIKKLSRAEKLGMLDEAR